MSIEYHYIYLCLLQFFLMSYSFQYTGLVSYHCCWKRFLNLLRLILWPNIWFVLENVSCALENLYSVAFDRNALYISIKSIWSKVLFKANIFLLIFHPNDLAIDINGVLKSPTILVLLSFSLYRSANICFIFKCSYVGCISIYEYDILLLDWPLYYHIMPFFCLITVCVGKLSLSDTGVAIPDFFWFSFAGTPLCPFTLVHVCP